MKKYRAIKIASGLLVFVIAAIGVGTIWLPLFNSLRIVGGTFFVLVLPGFILSFVFFPEGKSIIGERDETIPALDWVERMTLALALSLSVVPLTVYLANRIGLPITTTNVVVLIAGIIFVSIAILVWRVRSSRHP